MTPEVNKQVQQLFNNILANYTGDSQRILWVLPVIPTVSPRTQMDNLAEGITHYLGIQAGRLFGKAGRLFSDWGRTVRYRRTTNQIEFGLIKIYFEPADRNFENRTRALNCPVVVYDSLFDNYYYTAQDILGQHILPRSKHQVILATKPAPFGGETKENNAESR